MGNMPAPVGPNPIEELMASINQPLADPLSSAVREAVADGIAQLGDKDKWLIEAVFVWGHSYSEIADMMGYRSKASVHGVVRKALDNLKMVLECDHRIMKLLGRKGNAMADETWADSSWTKVRAMDRSANAGSFDPVVLDTHFKNMGNMVRNNQLENLHNICWAAGCEAARALVAMGEWDMEKLQDTLCSKQHDYGHENINAFGIVGVAVRLSDKIARWRNIKDRRNKVANETVVDTLLDMVGYAIISSMLEDGSFQNPLGDPF